MNSILWFFFFKELFKIKKNKDNTVKINKIKDYLVEHDTDEERDDSAYIFFLIPLVVVFIFIMIKAANII